MEPSRGWCCHSFLHSPRIHRLRSTLVGRPLCPRYSFCPVPGWYCTLTANNKLGYTVSVVAARRCLKYAGGERTVLCAWMACRQCTSIYGTPPPSSPNKSPPSPVLVRAHWRGPRDDNQTNNSGDNKTGAKLLQEHMTLFHNIIIVVVITILREIDPFMRTMCHPHSQFCFCGGSSTSSVW